MANKMTNPMKVITGPKTRWSYANVWEPKSINGGTAKYSVCLLIPKEDTVTVEKIKKAIEAAYKEGEAKLKGNGKSVPPLAALKTPLRDGDVEKPDDESYAGHYFLNANNTTAPGIVNSSGSKGIACSLNNLQKIADGEHLGGKASAEEDFATEEDDDFLS